MRLVDEKGASEKVCLVFIFNHRYDENIEKLKAIYQERFSRIRFLVPFYEGTCKEVIPVYESSYQFPGFLIQGYDKLVNEEKADYYLFVSDDLILSPDINENNVLNRLKMQGKSFFISWIVPLNMKGAFGWHHARFSSVPFFNKMTQWKNSIPEYSLALERFSGFFGEHYKEEYEGDFFSDDLFGKNLQKKDKEIDDFIQRNGNSRKIPYPMAWGYSDIFMIKADTLFTVARLCGVFSAMNMFAEISLPTAAVLSIPRSEVVVLDETGYGKNCAWTNGERVLLEEKYQRDIEVLYENWESKSLYIHPIKLSGWKIF